VRAIISSRRNAWRSVAAPIFAAAVVTVTVLSGCSSSKSKASAPSVSVTGSAATTAAATAPSSGTTSSSSSPSSLAASAATGGGDCGGAVDRVKAAVSSFKEVVGVQMIAGCSEVDIATSLAPGVLGSPSAETAVTICTAAAAVAYQGAVSSITLDATDHSEVATGIKGQDCIPG
jgi:hypothetical protein